MLSTENVEISSEAEPPSSWNAQGPACRPALQPPQRQQSLEASHGVGTLTSFECSQKTPTAKVTDPSALGSRKSQPLVQDFFGETALHSSDGEYILVPEACTCLSPVQPPVCTDFISTALRKEKATLKGSWLLKLSPCVWQRRGNGMDSRWICFRVDPRIRTT